MPTNKRNARPSCHNVNGRVVCGALKGGGKPHKAGNFLLHKGEQVFTPAQIRKMKTQGKKTKLHVPGRKKKKCSCKH